MCTHDISSLNGTRKHPCNTNPNTEKNRYRKLKKKKKTVEIKVVTFNVQL